MIEKIVANSPGFDTELVSSAGLCHLHSLRPPLIQRNFKSANAIVDEDFIAKVADTGMKRLLEKIDEAGQSRAAPSSSSPFLDPEARESGSFSETSDVYSFGVFLPELVAGIQAPRGSVSTEFELTDRSSARGNFHDGRTEGLHQADNTMPDLAGKQAAEDGHGGV